MRVRSETEIYNSGCRGTVPHVVWDHVVVGSNPTIPPAAVPHCGYGDATEGAFPLLYGRRHKPTKSARSSQSASLK